MISEASPLIINTDAQASQSIQLLLEHENLEVVTEVSQQRVCAIWIKNDAN